MENICLYNKIFTDVFAIDSDSIVEIKKKSSENWDSLNKMALIAAIEEYLIFNFTIDEMLKFNSYEDGISILKNHNIL